MYPVVLDELETLALLEQGRSIARYGDGELKLCRGAGIKCQEFDPTLSGRLRDILKSDSDCVVAIPRISPISTVAEEKRAFWSQYLGDRYTAMYAPGKTYGSAFITRPDSIPEIEKSEYFERVKRLWTGRNVVLINGDNRPFDKRHSILSNAREHIKWVCPSQNAWSVYQGFLDACQSLPKDTLFILSAGPTATVLAFDLCQLGYQALDMGHLGMFYGRMFSE